MNEEKENKLETTGTNANESKIPKENTKSVQIQDQNLKDSNLMQESIHLKLE